jgi:hypothetical protein
MALDNLAKAVRTLHEAVTAGRMTREDADSDSGTLSADDILGVSKLDPKLAKQRIIQVKNALAGAIGGNNYRVLSDGDDFFSLTFDRRRKPTVLRALEAFPWATATVPPDDSGDQPGNSMELTIDVNPDGRSQWAEALIPATGGPMVGRKPTEAVKKAVDPSHPTEPIENNGDAPAGSPDALPPFGSMVEAAKVALLDRKDPHEAVEALLGEGEPEDETLVVRAVEAALALLDIAVKAPEPAPPEGE